MLRNVYLLLAQHLKAALPWARQVDLFLSPEEQGELTVDAPAVLIEFADPIKWTTYPHNLQDGTLAVSIHLFTDTEYGDHRDITDTRHIDHLAKESDIYLALQGTHFTLSLLTGQVLPSSETNPVVINALNRTLTQPHSQRGRLVWTTQVFEATVLDYTALPEWKTLLAAFSCEVDYQ